MRQWEVWTYDFDQAGPHPAVVISHPDRVARAPLVNVLLCSTHRATRAARETELLLDSADGLDWETIVRCDLTYLVEKTSLHKCRGIVSSPRRRAIVQKIIACFGFDLI